MRLFRCDDNLGLFHRRSPIAGALEPSAFEGPKFSGCGEFNPIVEADAENRRVTLTVYGDDAPNELSVASCPSTCSWVLTLSRPRGGPRRWSAIRGAFVTLPASSDPASGVADAPPSWHDAHAMGLEGREIEAIFKQTSLASLKLEGIDETLRGSKGPKKK